MEDLLGVCLLLVWAGLGAYLMVTYILPVLIRLAFRKDDEEIDQEYEDYEKRYY